MGDPSGKDLSRRNAIAVNDQRITSDKHVIGAKDITPEGVIKLSLGKKRHVLIKPV